MLDLVEGGSTWDEVVQLAQVVEAAGATLINTGIGWHEARIPTIATMVPRAAFAWVTRRLKGAVKIPLITTNRINDPGDRSRPCSRAATPTWCRWRGRSWRMPDFVVKAAREPRRRDQHVHRLQPGVPRPHLRAADRVVPRQSVRVPRDGDEVAPAREAAEGRGRRRGTGGPRVRADRGAERGHYVTLFEAAGEIGGQFNLARRIPGKEEFAETLRYYRTRLAASSASRVELNRRVSADNLRGFDRVILATGIVPRVPDIPGIDHPKVASYVEIVEGRKTAGRRVAIVGAGGIGFDVGEFLTAGYAAGRPRERRRASTIPRSSAFRDEWGIDADVRAARRPEAAAGSRRRRARLWLLQRKDEKVGAGLAKTTGWIRRALLKKRGVAMIAGVRYERIDDAGLHITVDGKPRVARRGHDRDLRRPGAAARAGRRARRGAASRIELIGGADVALELDAKRAIDQGTRVAMEL